MYRCCVGVVSRRNSDTDGADAIQRTEKLVLPVVFILIIVAISQYDTRNLLTEGTPTSTATIRHVDSTKK